EARLAAPDAARRDLELLEEDDAQLRRRVDVELAAGELVDLPHEPLELGAHLRGQAPKRGDVERDPRELHVGEDRRERHLEVAEQALHLVRAQELLERRLQAMGGTRGPARRLGRIAVGRTGLTEQLL